MITDKAFRLTCSYLWGFHCSIGIVDLYTKHQFLHYCSVQGRGCTDTAVVSVDGHQTLQGTKLM